MYIRTCLFNKSASAAVSSLNRKGSILALSSPRESNTSRTKEKSLSIKTLELEENADDLYLESKYFEDNKMINNREIIIKKENENVNNFGSQLNECSSTDSNTFFMNEIMSKNVLNIFEDISSIHRHDQIRNSSQQKNTNHQSKSPKLAEFRVLCTALVITYKNYSEIKSKIIKNNANNAEKDGNDDKKMENKMITAISPYKVIEKTDRLTDDLATLELQLQLQLQLQIQLQQALDDLNMNDVATAVALGAVVEPTHIRQAALHFGDEYVSLFSFLLSSGEIYIADR